MSDLTQSIENYLGNCERVRRVSAHTSNAYRSDLTQFAAMLPGEALNIEIIQSNLKRIAENPEYEVSTVRRKLSAIRGFLRAIDEELATQTFVTLKLKMRTPRHLPKAISRNELSAILKSAREGSAGTPEWPPTTHLVLSLLAATGLRIAELCALRLSDVNSNTGEIKVIGKGSRERVVIVTNNRVRQRLGRLVRNRMKLDGPGAPLFRNQRGNNLTPQCMRLRLHRLVRRAGLEVRVTPHMLRHTAATLLIERGVDIRFVQRLLGHASISTTETYTHVTDKALRNALERADVMRGFV
jgi:integrase/recombinase XerD